MGYQFKLYMGMGVPLVGEDDPGPLQETHTIIEMLLVTKRFP